MLHLITALLKIGFALVALLTAFILVSPQRRADFMHGYRTTRARLLAEQARRAAAAAYQAQR